MKPMSREVVALLVGAAIVISPVAPVDAQAPPAGQRAGEVSAQLPQGQVARPGERLLANVGTAILWNDLVETDARGRVRITLGDASMLNVGSNSSLRVVQHEQQTRQTDLTLTFGKMRSRLQKLGGGQRFEIRTNTAVIGVIGTDFFVEATATLTRVIVYEGMVLVRNINPAVPGERRVAAGAVVLIFADQPPFQPMTAEPAELTLSVEDTAVGEELPAPRARVSLMKKLTKNKWLLVGLIAVVAAVSISVPLATGGTKASGCEVPSPSCP